jgi:hypothetical protein
MSPAWPFMLFTITKAKPLKANLEDIAPNALNLLGCVAKAQVYSTGNTLTRKSNFTCIVSTQGSKVWLLTNTQFIEIMNNANVSVFD